MINEDSIVTRVCDFFNLTNQQILSVTRKDEIVLARQICMFILLRKTDLTLTAIGHIFGQAHSNVIWAREKIMKAMRDNEDLRNDVDYLMESVNENCTAI